MPITCRLCLTVYASPIALHHPRLSSYSALWNDLGLSLISTRRKLHLAQLMFKCHNSLASPHLSSLFYEPSHRYSTCNSNLVKLPPVKSSYGQRSLSFFGVSLWCSLPVSIHNSDSLVCDHLHGYKSTIYCMPINIVLFFTKSANAVAEYCTAVSCPNAPNTF